MRRDPIGYRGGVNVYGYVYSMVSLFKDAYGLDSIFDMPIDISIPEDDVEFDLEAIKPDDDLYTPPDDSYQNEAPFVISYRPTDEDCKIVIYWGHSSQVSEKRDKFERLDSKKNRIGLLGCFAKQSKSHGIPGFPDVSKGRIGVSSEVHNNGELGNGGRNTGQKNNPTVQDMSNGWLRLLEDSWRAAEDYGKNTMCRQHCCSQVLIIFVGIRSYKPDPDGWGKPIQEHGRHSMRYRLAQVSLRYRDVAQKWTRIPPGIEKENDGTIYGGRRQTIKCSK